MSMRPALAVYWVLGQIKATKDPNSKEKIKVAIFGAPHTLVPKSTNNIPWAHMLVARLLFYLSLKEKKVVIACDRNSGISRSVGWDLIVCSFSQTLCITYWRWLIVP